MVSFFRPYFRFKTINTLLSSQAAFCTHFGNQGAGNTISETGGIVFSALSIPLPNLKSGLGEKIA
jgi:hypothetical protein